MKSISGNRIASIDTFRAITMLLMIWVNDYAGVPDLPKWMLHATDSEDYLGFSDIIFPLFLFIVGLSIPLAIQNRLKRKATTWSTAKHILSRGFSLLLIGVFMVNYESAPADLYLLGKQGWCFVMAIGVTLVWMDWRRSPLPQQWHMPLRLLGILILLGLVFIYAKSGQWMSPQWWGILGLIGWAYLVNALLFLVYKGKLVGAVMSMLVFFGLSVCNALDLLPTLAEPLKYFGAIYSGTTPAFTAVGILVMLLYQRVNLQNQSKIISLSIGLGAVFLILGLATRPIWGISKIQATPSWLWVCLAIGLLSLAVLYFVVDVKQNKSWASIIKPAGTATLTCYLIPYYVYPFKSMASFYPFTSINSGFVGILLSLSFAFLVVLFTGWLEKAGFKLKL